MRATVLCSVSAESRACLLHIALLLSGGIAQCVEFGIGLVGASVVGVSLKAGEGEVEEGRIEDRPDHHGGAIARIISVGRDIVVLRLHQGESACLEFGAGLVGRDGGAGRWLGAE